MTVEEIYDFFGDSKKFERETGMSHGNIFNWSKKGYVPYLSQVKIERITKRKLKANIEHSNDDL